MLNATKWWKPEVRQPKQMKLTEFCRPNMSIARKVKLDRMLLLMIVKDIQPFSVVDDAGFVNCVSEREPSYKMPSLLYG